MMDKIITELVDNKVFDEYFLMYKIVSHKVISNEYILVSYINKLEVGIVKSYKLYIIKIVNYLKYK